MATIQRRVSKAGIESFRVGWRKDGKQHWSPTLTSGTGAEELKSLIERIGPDAAISVLNRRSGREVASGPPLLENWTVRHLEMLGASATAGTVAEYRRMAERTWLPRLGALPLDAVTREAVIDWVAWQRGQESRRSRLARERAMRDGREVPAPVMVSPKTIRNAHGLLSSVLSSAVTAGHLPGNLAAGVSLPNDVAEDEKDIFTEAEWQAFYAAMHDHYKTFILFLVSTGARFGEVSALQARDIDLDATATVAGELVSMPTAHIRRAWKKGETPTKPVLGAPKSRRSRRTVVLPAHLVDAVRPMLADLDPEDALFTTITGKRIDSAAFRRHYWGPALERAGITKSLTPHSLRHTSASWLLMAGVPAQVVQHRLGHESLSTTSRTYAHLLTDAQLIAVQATQRAIGGTPRQIEG